MHFISGISLLLSLCASFFFLHVFFFLFLFFQRRTQKYILVCFTLVLSRLSFPSLAISLALSVTKYLLVACLILWPQFVQTCLWPWGCKGWCWQNKCPPANTVQQLLNCSGSPHSISGSSLVCELFVHPIAQMKRDLKHQNDVSKIFGCFARSVINKHLNK